MPPFLTGVILLALVLLASVIWRPASLEGPGGRLFLLLALFVLPAFSTVGGFSHHLETSKRTEFCLSCHEMEPYGQTLWLEDGTYLPAAHFVNARVPRDHACYTCHTQYTMFGNLAAKWRGLNHVWVHYVQKPPAPGDISLYAPYQNRECLHCHANARSYVESAGHQGLLETLTREELSCVDCHAKVHPVDGLASLPLWNPEDGGADARH